MRLSSEVINMDVCTSPRVIQKGRRSQVQKSSETMTNPLGVLDKNNMILRWFRVHDLPMRKRKERLMQN